MTLFLSSCYDDKGNYDYSEQEVIEISLPDDVKAMANAGIINLNPTITSSINGEITPNSNDYVFNCKVQYNNKNENTGETDKWLDVNETKSMNVSFPANFPASTYKYWYSVTNKKSNVTFSKIGTFKLISSTYEGWMVLSNDINDGTLKLGMISKDADNNTIIVKNTLEENAGKLKNGTQVVLIPSKYATGDILYLMSKDGSYRLNANTLEYDVQDNIKNTDFIVPSITGTPVTMNIINGKGTYNPTSRLTVMDNGDAYALTNRLAGASFETPLNTNVAGGNSTYRVSPFVGVSMARPGNSELALLYDIDNKCFKGWNYSATDNSKLASITDPDMTEKKFSYNTGMELITMKSTKYSNGLVYAVLEDSNSKRHVYGINISGENFKQESIYENISAPHFNEASDYAFHSQYPLMCYSYMNEIYCYNLATGKYVKTEIETDETISMIKFNLFVNMQPADLTDQSDEFMNQQYELIVGSNKAQEGSGKVRFYKVGSNGDLTFDKEFAGFEKIADVTYRERR